MSLARSLLGMASRPRNQSYHHLQPPYQMSQLTGASRGIFSPRAHVNDGSSVFVKTCKEAVSRSIGP